MSEILPEVLLNQMITKLKDINLDLIYYIQHHGLENDQYVYLNEKSDELLGMLAYFNRKLYSIRGGANDGR